MSDDIVKRLTRERDEALAALNSPSKCGEEACVWHVTQHFKIVEANKRAEAAERKAEKLRKALSHVEQWWLEEGQQHFSGAPYAIFNVRAALAETEKEQ